MKLPPEQFGGMQNRRDEIDAFGLHRAVDDRPCPRVIGDADAQLQIHERVLVGWAFRLGNFAGSFCDFAQFQYPMIAVATIPSTPPNERLRPTAWLSCHTRRS